MFVLTKKQNHLFIGNDPKIGVEINDASGDRFPNLTWWDDRRSMGLLTRFIDVLCRLFHWWRELRTGIGRVTPFEWTICSFLLVDVRFRCLFVWWMLLVADHLKHHDHLIDCHWLFEHTRSVERCCTAWYLSRLDERNFFARCSNASAVEKKSTLLWRKANLPWLAWGEKSSESVGSSHAKALCMNPIVIQSMVLCLLFSSVRQTVWKKSACAGGRFVVAVVMATTFTIRCKRR